VLAYDERVVERFAHHAADRAKIGVAVSYRSLFFRSPEVLDRFHHNLVVFPRNTGQWPPNQGVSSPDDF
jgi:hypothetical protein